MKIKYTLYAIVVLAISFTASANAQLTAKAAVNVTFVTPLSIAVTTPMSFGNLIVPNNGDISQVQLRPDGTYTLYGPITVHSGSITPATLTVRGDVNTTFQIGMPSGGDLFLVSDTEGANTDLSLRGFMSTGFMEMLSTDESGVKVVPIAAVLNIPAGVTVIPATYYVPDGGFEVSVNYM